MAEEAPASTNSLRITVARSSGLCAVEPIGPATRLILQARHDQLEVIAIAYGWPPPAGLLRAQSNGARSTLALGPTELLLIEQGADRSLRNQAAPPAPHSMVDVSHRQVALRLAGPDARDRLSSSCPLDLNHERFPAGSCTRTILGRCEIVLWRTGADSWQVECWRSFAQYVHQVLATPW